MGGGELEDFVGLPGVFLLVEVKGPGKEFEFVAEKSRRRRCRGGR